MNEVYDIVAVAITILALISFILTWNLDPNERYIINLEYYSLETFLKYKLDGVPIYEMLMEGDLDPRMKNVLDEIVPNGYYYLLEIPEYNFRITNVEGASNVETCVQLDKIYPINYNFNDIHLIFGIWNTKYRVIKCVG